MSDLKIYNNASIHIKVNGNVKAAFRKLARNKGITVSAYIKEFITDELRANGVSIEKTVKLV